MFDPTVFEYFVLVTVIIGFTIVVPMLLVHMFESNSDTSQND